MRDFLNLIAVNLLRHKLRSLFGICGIAFGVASVIAVLSIVLGAIGMFQRILGNETQALVFERNVSDLFFSSVNRTQLRGIEGVKGVSRADPILFGIVSSEGHPVVTCFGVQAENPRITKARWLEGNVGHFGMQPETVYLGKRAARFMNAHLGETVPIGNGHFTVGGVLETENGFEDGGVFMPLETAQTFFHREGLCSVIALRIADDDRVEEVLEAVNAHYPELLALPNAEFEKSYSQFRILSMMAWGVGICTFLLGGLGVANTMLMSVFSRVREIAVLRVCGFSKSQVAFLVVGESLTLAFIGLVLGSVGGFVLVHAMTQIDLFQGYIQTALSWSIFLGVIALTLFTSLASALYPALFAAHIEPVRALAYE